MRKRATSTMLATTVLVSALAFGEAGAAAARQDSTTSDPGTTASKALSDGLGLLTSALLSGTDPTTLPFSDIDLTMASAAFAEYGKTVAVTYDKNLVPVGSTAEVFAASGSELSTTTQLKVQGLVPDREYGAHAHTEPCGPDPADAGGHFQYRKNPTSSSNDPAYANPDNEIWLDFTTDGTGAAKAVSDVEWTLGERKPASVVIHKHHTLTGEGEAGDAGARLACIDVDF